VQNVLNENKVVEWKERKRISAEEDLESDPDIGEGSVGIREVQKINLEKMEIEIEEK